MAETRKNLFFFLIALATKVFVIDLTIFFFFFFFWQTEFFPRTMEISQKVSKMGDIARNV